MFIEFSVSNFRSIKEKQTFSLVASKNKELQEENTFPINAKTHLLRTAVVYGANASGKTNFFQALSFFFRFAVTSAFKQQVGDAIRIEPFLFDITVRGQPSVFEIIFLIGDTRYRYGFAADHEKIHHEYLFAVQKVREVILFTRENQTIEVNTTYFREGGSRKEFARENATFLSVCAQNNGEIATRIVTYFKTITVTSGLQHYTSLTLDALQNDKIKSSVIDFLKFADIQINDLKTEKTSLDFSNIPDQELKEVMSKKFGDKVEDKVFFGHTVYDGGKPVDEQFMEFHEESSGTRKLFEYTGPILETLGKGTPLFIDEFDSRLHPLIIEMVLKLFNSPVSNPKNAQLVVSCHAVNIMTNKMFRRDQIWFCEKDAIGATEMYSLVEYKEPVRNDASFSKNYLQGKYGAIPYLSDIFKQTERVD